MSDIELNSGHIPLGPIHHYLEEPGVTGDGFAATSPLTGPIPTGSYLEGINDCLEICEQELGLCAAGSREADAIAKIIHRIQGELI